MGKHESCMAWKTSVGPRGIALSLGIPILAATALKNAWMMLNHPALPDKTC